MLQTNRTLLQRNMTTQLITTLTPNLLQLTNMLDPWTQLPNKIPDLHDHLLGMILIILYHHHKTLRLRMFLPTRPIKFKSALLANQINMSAHTLVLFEKLSFHVSRASETLDQFIGAYF